MNWKEIKEKYPKAWDIIKSVEGWPNGHEEYKFYSNFDKGIAEYECGDWDMRDLYDFFDTQDILVYIVPGHAYSPSYAGKFYTYLIMDYNKSLMYDDPKKTRGVIENMAFQKAFGILEIKLNK